MGIDTDEDASPGDLSRIVNHRPVFERDQCRLDFAETLIDLIGQLVGILIIGFKLGLLGVECVDGGLLLWGEIDRFAVQLAQAIRAAVGELHGDRNPLPAFGCNRLSLGFELFRHETVEQSNVLKPAAIIVLEQIPQNAATACS